ncbi:MAG: tripartite tricarboxylate transporter TctB family protein [Armatimonadota bacterium]|nr:tripartite tricarboxylate transporter TctB family protein [Armatimonadota bacterium]MDR7475853.1 tripartite tricarboxylate transporter TctB family protein [Armatimonadota bacterium]
MAALMVVAGLATWVVPVDSGGQAWYLGPALFPRLVGVVLLAGGAVSLTRRHKPEQARGAAGASPLRVLALVAGLLAGARLVGWIGLPLTAAGLAGLGGMLLGLRPVRAVAVALGVWVLARVVFLQLLGVGR